MAVLTDAERREVWSQWMRENFETCAATKPELRQLIDSLDDYLETNATAINQAIPVAIRSKFTVAQKARALAYVALKRWGGV